ncbi:hypothetical protein LJC58_08185 [Lachnospiraceae bacterium OttesenSCG-928-D06]|nr:hypothetical protein [Lachnospiraceae bacterium OttesenSCG-928-D06]
MKAKTILEAMKTNAVQTLGGMMSTIYDIEEVVAKKEDGSFERSIRVSAEVVKEKANRMWSGLRYTVKIPNGVLKLTEEELEESDYFVSFENLSISFIDSRNNVYFKAEDYSVEINE